MTSKPKQEEATASVDLKDPALAALLAWLIPGLGHLYQRRIAKAVLYFVCIVGTFSYGLYLGSDSQLGWGRVVYASWRPGDKRFHYLAQIGVGLPALPAMVQAVRVRSGKAPFGNFMAPPPLSQEAGPHPNQPTLSEIHRRLGRFFELGTVYTVIAGLLNYLAIFDAWAGPAMVAHKEDEDEEEGDPAETKSDANQKSPAGESDPTVSSQPNRENVE